MYVEPHYDGTRVSYFYPVGGGATPQDSPIVNPTPAYRFVGYYLSSISGIIGFVYNGSKFLDIIYPNVTQTLASAIDGENIVGYTYTAVNSKYSGFLYKNANFTDINHPTGITAIHGINGSNIVGVGGNKGFLYNGSSFTDIEYPEASATRAKSINGAYIAGEASFLNRNQIGWIYNGSNFDDIVYPGSSRIIIRGNYGETVVGEAIKIINFSEVFFPFIYKNGAFVDISYPGASTTSVIGIDGPIIAGIANINGVRQVFITDGIKYTDLGIQLGLYAPMGFDIG
jgi:hypothetical protein